MVLNTSSDASAGSWAMTSDHSASWPTLRAGPATVTLSGPALKTQPAGAEPSFTWAGVIPAGRNTCSDLIPALVDSASPVNVTVTLVAPACVLSASTSTWADAGAANAVTATAAPTAIATASRTPNLLRT